MRACSVDFTGWVGRGEIDALFAGSDLLVLPSLWPEPLALVGLEAARHRLPVAAFDVGGIGEWLTPGRNGYLAPGNPPTVTGLTAAIVACLRIRRRTRDLRDGAGRLSADFSFDTHVDLLLRAFNDVARAALAFMRILVAHQVPRARTGGMSRLMAFIHDRIESAGHEVDYFCCRRCAAVVGADGGEGGWRFRWRFAPGPSTLTAGTSVRHRERARAQRRAAAHRPPRACGRGRRSPATASSGVRGSWRRRKAVSAVKAPGWRTRITYPPTRVVAWRLRAPTRRSRVLPQRATIGRLSSTIVHRSPASVTRVFPGADEIYAAARPNGATTRARRACCLPAPGERTRASRIWSRHSSRWPSVTLTSRCT